MGFYPRWQTLEFRWDGEAWIGTDMNRLWFKSEGFVENGKASDGITEALYDRPIPHLRYFDVQAGVRYDLDSNPGLTWGAIGIEGLAPNFFEFEPTFYFSDRGRLAARVNGSYDLLITNRLILQPQFELNFYSKRDPSRGTGSGLLFDWLVTGQVLDANPAHSIRGPKYVVKKGKTPVLTAEEARELLDSIPIVRKTKHKDGTVAEQPAIIGLRDRALIAVMVYTFARVNAVLQMKVRDYFAQGRRGWVRLHEKGGKEHEVPCHHNLEEYLDEYIAAAGIAADPNGPLFRTAVGKTGALTGNAMWQQDAYRMIQRCSTVAGIKTRIGNHTFRATGITAYLKNKGTLETAQHIANHESPRTTKLYDRRQDEISLDEVEKISI